MERERESRKVKLCWSNFGMALIRKNCTRNKFDKHRSTFPLYYDDVQSEDT